ncbi:MAG: DUF1275 family protein [Allobaculum sp.]|nr:DUF1275 family protein [Allobaculum sp.]
MKIHEYTLQEEKALKELVTKDKQEDVESVRAGVLLTMSIGILNACTYVTRGKVFASSQSGNLLYLGLDLAQGDFSKVPKYLFPPLMFALGVIIAEHYHDKPNYPQWRRKPFYLEIFLIVLATFLPDSWNALANPIFGLCCGLQTITFRKIRSTPVATVVINGSFQNSFVHWTRWFHLSDREDAFRGWLYTLIVLSYVGGIAIGGLLCPYLDHYVSLVSAGLLILCCVIALPKEKFEKNPSRESLEAHALEKDVKVHKKIEKLEAKLERKEDQEKKLDQSLEKLSSQDSKKS